MREAEAEEDYCSASLVVWCPACKEEGKILKCQKIEDGYGYVIDHEGGTFRYCTIIEEHERHQILHQIKLQRTAIKDICLRYLCAWDRKIVDEMFLDLRDV